MPPINSIKLKQLTQVPSFGKNDSLVVDTEDGTFLLTKKFLVIANDNISFYNAFVGTSATYVNINSSAISILSGLSATANRNLTTSVSSLSTTISNNIQRMFYKTGSFTISQGRTSSISTTITVSAGIILSAYDVNMFFISSAVPLNSALPLNVFPSLTGNKPNYRLQAFITNAALSAVDIGYNIKKNL